MNSGYRVDYDNEHQICIVPMPKIPINVLIDLIRLYDRRGYKFWLPADERQGFIFSKNGRGK